MAAISAGPPFNWDCFRVLRNFGRSPPDHRQRLSASFSGLRRGPTNLQMLVNRPVSAVQAVQQAQPSVQLSGKWHKDKSQSDSMQEACDAVQLKWVLRRALAILNTLEIEDNSEYFQTNIKAGGIMDVVERYPWTGESKQHARRDKRAGHHTGKVVKTDKGPSIQVHFDDPFGGKCNDTFSLSNNGQHLTQETEMTMNTGQQCNYKTVFRRS